MIPRMQRPCLEPGCGTLAPPGKSRCQRHTREQQAAHNAKSQPYYTASYRAARAEVMATRGYCTVQLNAPTPCKGELTVHHLDHDRANNNLDNLWCLCASHHYALEASHQKGEVGRTGQALLDVLASINGDDTPPPTPRF